MTDRLRHIGTTGAVRLAIAALQSYQVVLRPLLLGSCKFCPSCITDRDHKALAGKLSRAKKLATQIYPPETGEDTETGKESSEAAYRIFRILDEMEEVSPSAEPGD